jgi:hypothetical protein
MHPQSYHWTPEQQVARDADRTLAAWSNSENIVAPCIAPSLDVAGIEPAAFSISVRSCEADTLPLSYTPRSAIGGCAKWSSCTINERSMPLRVSCVGKSPSLGSGSAQLLGKAMCAGACIDLAAMSILSWPLHQIWLHQATGACTCHTATLTLLAGMHSQTLTHEQAGCLAIVVHPTQPDTAMHSQAQLPLLASRPPFTVRHAVRCCSTTAAAVRCHSQRLKPQPVWPSPAKASPRLQP